MRAEIGEPIPGSVLGKPAADAGRRAYRVQAALTRARDKQAFQLLDVRVRDLPATDARRLAWLNVNRFSASWVASWPSPDAWLSDAQFMEVSCRYFGLPSPACAPLAGRLIGSTRTPLDVQGFSLCAASLPGDGWRAQHDALKWTLFEDVRAAGA
eukprot:10442467-Karenia_brevis.AAC.1